MFFWLTAAALTLGASLAVLLPLTRSKMSLPVQGAHDLEVYRDQLGEIDRDAERGTLEAGEIEQARAEIARRILRVNGEGRSEKRAAARRSTRWLSAAAVLAVPLVSWSMYGALGSPSLPSQPLAARLLKEPSDSSMAELVARAENYLAANPGDVRGWDVLAPIYLRLGRYDDARNGFGQAIRIGGETAARLTGLGEAATSSAGGMVTADARDAFTRALSLAPPDPKARFFMAMAMAQDGRTSEAMAGWQYLASSAPAGSPWRGAAEQAIAEARTRLAAADGAATLPGPDRAAVEAAAALPDADRATMIETMVASLAEKLRDNPQDPEGWTRLVRSYVVLNRPAEARQALADATAALGAGSDAARRLADLAGSLGLTVTVTE